MVMIKAEIVRMSDALEESCELMENLNTGYHHL